MDRKPLDHLLAPPSVNGVCQFWTPVTMTKEAVRLGHDMTPFYFIGRHVNNKFAIVNLRRATCKREGCGLQIIYAGLHDIPIFDALATVCKGIGAPEGGDIEPVIFREPTRPRRTRLS